MHSSKRAITGRDLDILCGVLRPHMPSPLPSAKLSPPEITSLPSYGNLLKHTCGEGTDLSIVNIPQGMIKTRAPEYAYTVAISNDPLTASWRLNHSEGILEGVRIVVLPPKTHYEIRIHGNSYLFLLELCNSKIFTNISPIGTDLPKKPIHTDQSSVEFYTEEKKFFIQDFHTSPETKTYVSTSRTNVIWLEDQKLKMNNVTDSKIITVNPETPHSVISESFPLFTITTKNPKNKKPNHIMITRKEIIEALRL